MGCERGTKYQVEQGVARHIQNGLWGTDNQVQLEKASMTKVNVTESTMPENSTLVLDFTGTPGSGRQFYKAFLASNLRGNALQSRVLEFHESTQILCVVITKNTRMEFRVIEINKQPTIVCGYTKSSAEMNFWSVHRISTRVTPELISKLIVFSQQAIAKKSRPSKVARNERVITVNVIANLISQVEGFKSSRDVSVPDAVTAVLQDFAEREDLEVILLALMNDPSGQNLNIGNWAASVNATD